MLFSTSLPTKRFCSSSREGKENRQRLLYIENTAERQMIHHLQIIKPARDISRWAPWAPTAKTVSIKSKRGKTEAAESPKMHPTGFLRTRRDVSHCRCVSSRARQGPPIELCCFRLHDSGEERARWRNHAGVFWSRSECV